MFQTKVYALGRIYFDDRFSLGLGGFAQYDIINKKFLVLDYVNKQKERFLSVGPQIMPVFISGQHEFQYALSASLFNIGSRNLTPEEGSGTKVSGASFSKTILVLKADSHTAIVSPKTLDSTLIISFTTINTRNRGRNRWLSKI